MNKPSTTSWLVIAERLYSILLCLYPADYRRDYGALMRQFFRDVMRERYRRQGIAGVVLWWCKTLLDLVLTVIEQRRKANFTMSKATLTQTMSYIASIMLVAGGSCGAIAAFSQLQPGDHDTYYGIYQALLLFLMPGFLFIGLGCIGLALRYENSISIPTKWSLYLMGISSVAMAFSAVGMLAQAAWWNLWFVSAAVHVGALLVFGLLFARKPFLPIFRWLPLQMGSGWLMLAGITDLFPQFTDNLLTFLMMFGLHIAWLAIGQTLTKEQSHVADSTLLPVANR